MSIAKNLLDSAFHYLIDADGEYVTVTDATRAPLSTPNAALASQRAALATAGSTHTPKDRHILARSTGATVIARSTGHDIFSRGGTPQLSTPKSPLVVGQAHPYIPHSLLKLAFVSVDLTRTRSTTQRTVQDFRLGRRLPHPDRCSLHLLHLWRRFVMTAETTRPAMPPIVDRRTWWAEMDELLKREKAHTREGDAIAAARRQLPMVEVDATAPLIGPNGPVTLLDAFEGRTQLFVSYHMWHTGNAAADQCEGCTFFTGHVLELGYLHSRDVTFAVFCDGPFTESDRYRAFMGWAMPWYAVPEGSLERMAQRGHFGMQVCYLRDGDRVFETYRTTGRGAEVMTNSYGMLDMTVYGRQEPWEDSPAGWPQPFKTGDGGNQFRRDGRPISQWSRIADGRSDDLGTSGAPRTKGRCH